MDSFGVGKSEERHDPEARIFERAARDLDSVYRRAIEAAGAVPYVRDHRTERFAFLGDGILRLCGYSAEEMTPRLWDAIGVKSVMQGEAAGLTVEEAMGRSRSGRLAQWRCDTLIRCKSGEERWIAETSVEVAGPDATPIGAVGILVDVTDRKRAVDALVESERNLKEAQRLARMGSWTLDLEPYRLMWSDEIYRIFEIDPERHAASHEVFQMRVHPDDRNRVHAAVR
ncbi:MAG: PAS domain S-box protein, partial [Verrucomicrobiales bacterium]|nr:PAS domain S-box protein [Verrucomicrobiales bacterium]